MGRSNTEIGSVQRLFHIVEFIQREEPVTLSRIAKQTEIPKSTVHRYLSSLMENEYIIQNDGEYRISAKFLQFANTVQTRRHEYNLIDQKVREVADKSDELVQFIIEEHNKAVYLFEDIGSRGLWTGSYSRTFRPLHSTASGKSIMSTWSKEEIVQYADKSGLTNVTEQTITEVPELLNEIEQVRERGYATNDEESVQGLSAIAVPIGREDGENIGALTISGPSNRIDVSENTNEYAELLKNAKNELELNIRIT